MTRTRRIIEATAERLSLALPALCVDEELAGPVEVLKYRPEVSTVAKCPQLWVSTGGLERSDDPADGATLRTYVQVLSLQIGVFVAGQDQESVEIERVAYADLIQAVIEDREWVDEFGTALGGAGLDVEWQRTEPREAFRAESALYQETVIEFRVRSLVEKGRE